MANDLSLSGHARLIETYTKDHLNKAKMAEFLYVPKTDEAKRFTEALTRLTIEHEVKAKPRSRQRRADDLRAFTGAVGAFAADLLRNAGNSEAAGFMYRSSDREALGDTLVSSRSFDLLVAFWPVMGLIQASGYIQAREVWEGEPIDVGHYVKARRFRALPSLLSLAEECGLTPDTIQDHFCKEEALIRPVTVRDERYDAKGKRKQPRNIRLKGPSYEAEAQRVRRLNGILANAGFDLAEAPRVYRLFNRGNWPGFDFNMGGRFYCCSEGDWQQIPKEERAWITCRGEPTVEIDVRASHLFILSALNGRKLPIDEDPYDIEGIDRDVVKGLFSAIAGKGEIPTRWPQKLGKDYEAKRGRKLGKTYKLKDVIEALLKRHPVIGSIRRGSLDWARLQYEESECFLAAMLELGDHFQVGALPVHDSLIVAERDRELAIDILGLAYERRFGARPFIRVK
ncbi:hypothetical protein R5H32_03430 [Defluviimonas sp. D31]|uniref:hypothetical protein n=1 Tax=Defluviimonas sp. D31 TaxID=3083253 RepID=UPI00296F14D2|nr:hypothetical protein [Defluviimonas sp. D31]MDW4548398.1 hypothetical protein [Defluviimonas sp. D31]